MKKVIKQQMTRQLSFMLTNKQRVKIERMMKKLKLTSLSESIRICIDKYSYE
jgi:hypothetical protein